MFVTSDPLEAPLNGLASSPFTSPAGSILPSCPVILARNRAGATAMAAVPATPRQRNRRGSARLSRNTAARGTRRHSMPIPVPGATAGTGGVFYPGSRDPGIPSGNAPPRGC